jgi:hypothetical protein
MSGIKMRGAVGAFEICRSAETTALHYEHVPGGLAAGPGPCVYHWGSDRFDNRGFNQGMAIRAD